jgi:hypothetical protein
VFLIDHSYSMGYEDRLSRAKAEVEGRIQSLAGEDLGSVVVFSDRAEVLNQPTSDKAALGAAVAGIQLSARATGFGPGLKLAKRILDESQLSRKEVVLVTDFPAARFRGEDDDVWLPAGTMLTPVDLSTAETENLSITSVSLERDEASGRQRLTASARVIRKAPRIGASLASRISDRRARAPGETARARAQHLGHHRLRSGDRARGEGAGSSGSGETLSPRTTSTTLCSLPGRRSRY